MFSDASVALFVSLGQSRAEGGGVSQGVAKLSGITRNLPQCYYDCITLQMEQTRRQSW